MDTNYNQEAVQYNQDATYYNQEPSNHDQKSMPETVVLKLPMFSEQIGPEAAAIYSHPDDNYYDYDYGSESAASWYQYQDNYHAQIGAAAIIQGPPADCEHGVLDISG